MPAVAIGGAILGGAALSSSAAKKASKAATGAANANNALPAEIYDQNKEILNPTITRGDVAGDRLSALLGLGGDEAAANDAFDKYLESTGYQFMRDQGRDAITSTRATQGLLNSGATLKSLEKYGQGVGSQAFGGYLGQLTDLSRQGLSAGSALAGVGTNYANAVGGNNNNAATAIGNGAISNANTWSNALGQLTGVFGQGIGQSSYAAPAAAAPYDPLKVAGFY